MCRSMPMYRRKKMSSKLTDCDNLVVGVRQAKRLLSERNVSKAYIAKDADPYITDPIIKKLKKLDIETEIVSSKKELGKMCKIDVDAAIAVIKKN